MNPIIVIPTYVSGHGQTNSGDVVTVYDHMTPINRQGELARCLGSLRDHGVDVPIGIIVVSSRGLEHEAQAKVEDIAKHFHDLEITIVGAEKEDALHDRMVRMGLGELCDGVSLSGYGALRNMGLVMAAVGGYDMVIFIDDDEVVENDDFLEKSCYGMGGLTPKGIPILVKSGYYLDKQGEYHARDKAVWYNKYWQRHEGFNEWIDSAMRAPRLSRGNTLAGGLMAIHREAFTRVSFDSRIARGEDLDYFLNVRMYGSEVWFDNEWSIRHLPPAERNEASRFTQEIYRWVYEHRKLEYAKSQVDLFQIPPQTLYPYPGPFLESSVLKNIKKTAVLRSVGIPEARKGYVDAAMVARKGALEYAQRYCADYFSFQYGWPEAIAMLERDPAVQGIFEYGRQEPLSGEALDQWRVASADNTFGQRKAARDADRAESDDAGSKSSSWRNVKRKPRSRGDRIFEYYGAGDAADVRPPSQDGEDGARAISDERADTVEDAFPVEAPRADDLSDDRDMDAQMSVPDPAEHADGASSASTEASALPVSAAVPPASSDENGRAGCVVASTAPQTASAAPAQGADKPSRPAWAKAFYERRDREIAVEQKTRASERTHSEVLKKSLLEEHRAAVAAAKAAKDAKDAEVRKSGVGVSAAGTAVSPMSGSTSGPAAHGSDGTPSAPDASAGSAAAAKEAGAAAGASGSPSEPVIDRKTQESIGEFNLDLSSLGVDD